MIFSSSAFEFILRIFALGASDIKASFVLLFLLTAIGKQLFISFEVEFGASFVRSFVDDEIFSYGNLLFIVDVWDSLYFVSDFDDSFELGRFFKFLLDFMDGVETSDVLGAKISSTSKVLLVIAGLKWKWVISLSSRHIKKPSFISFKS